MPSTDAWRPCLEESVDWHATRNLMIEGDNPEVLKLLQKSCAERLSSSILPHRIIPGSIFIYPDDYCDNTRNYSRLTGLIDGENRKLASNTEASGR